MNNLITFSGTSITKGSPQDVEITLCRNYLELRTPSSHVSLLASKIPGICRAAMNWVYCSIPIKRPHLLRVRVDQVSFRESNKNIVVECHFPWPVNESAQILLQLHNGELHTARELQRLWTGV